MSRDLRGIVLLFAVGSVVAADVQDAQKPQVVDLGDGRYRVGQVEVDSALRRFSVPGRVLRATPPIELLAVARDGRRSYEAMIELDATAFEFNLACNLIGLDATHVRVRPVSTYDPQVLDGDRVTLELTWEEGGVQKSRSPETLLTDGGPAPASDWVYIGSDFTHDGSFLANVDGTLIGLVHDPSSVVEHAVGLGMESGGSIAAISEAPPADTPVVLVVERSGGHEAVAADDEQ
jgi:hypothetical protein